MTYVYVAGTLLAFLLAGVADFMGVNSAMPLYFGTFVLALFLISSFAWKLVLQPNYSRLKEEGYLDEDKWESEKQKNKWAVSFRISLIFSAVALSFWLGGWLLHPTGQLADVPYGSMSTKMEWSKNLQNKYFGVAESSTNTKQQPVANDSDEMDLQGTEDKKLREEETSLVVVSNSEVREKSEIEATVVETKSSVDATSDEANLLVKAQQYMSSPGSQTITEAREEWRHWRKFFQTYIKEPAQMPEDLRKVALYGQKRVDALKSRKHLFRNPTKLSLHSKESRWVASLEIEDYVAKAWFKTSLDQDSLWRIPPQKSHQAGQVYFASFPLSDDGDLQVAIRYIDEKGNKCGPYKYRFQKGKANIAYAKNYLEDNPNFVSFENRGNATQVNFEKLRKLENSLRSLKFFIEPRGSWEVFPLDKFLLVVTTDTDYSLASKFQSSTMLYKAARQPRDIHLHLVFQDGSEIRKSFTFVTEKSIISAVG